MPAGVDEALLRHAVRRAAADRGPSPYYAAAEKQIAELEIKVRNLNAIITVGTLALALALLGLIYIYFRLDWAVCLLTGLGS